MDIKKLANLARLELTDDEATRYEAQLEDVLKLVEKLQEADVGGIEPMAHANPVFDVVREDVAHDENFSQEQALYGGEVFVKEKTPALSVLPCQRH